MWYILVRQCMLYWMIWWKKTIDPSLEIRKIWGKERMRPRNMRRECKINCLNRVISKNKSIEWLKSPSVISFEFFHILHSRITNNILFASEFNTFSFLYFCFYISVRCLTLDCLQPSSTHWFIWWVCSVRNISSYY